MFVFSNSRLGMWYKLHRYNWSREEREPSCQQCLLTVLMAPCSHEWTWGQRDMWELMVLSLDLGLKLKKAFHDNIDALESMTEKQR